MPKKTASGKRNPIRKFFSLLGPGLITGAADDDPSGIATYSIAGAQMGTAMLWTALITWPFMACVQFMCARIGMVTGTGLGGALRQKGPRWLLFGGALGLLAANTINVGSDLSGMADAAEMLTGINSHIYVMIFGVGIATATVRFRYHQIAMIMKWLAPVLFAYVLTAFLAGPNWVRVLRDTFIPSWPKDHAAWENLVAILGTTISPYLFFWQASQEVEEENAMGRRLLVQREGATKREIIDRKLDVGIGTFFSNLVMYFKRPHWSCIGTGSKISKPRNKQPKPSVRSRELWRICSTPSALSVLDFLLSPRSPVPPLTHLRKRFPGSKGSTSRFVVPALSTQC
jgi:Mn2+/Fe2+ NRAMP family transporter